MAKGPKKPRSDYEVGYGRPPSHSRYKAGKSGNPKGRPKGQPTIGQVFMKEAARLVRVKKGERIETISKLEGITRRILQMALEGDIAAARLSFAALAQDSKNNAETSEGHEDEEFALGTGAIPDDEALRRMFGFDHLRGERMEDEE